MYTSSSLKETADKSKGHGAFCQSDYIGFWTHGGIAKHPLKLPAEGAQIRQTERKKNYISFPSKLQFNPKTKRMWSVAGAKY